MSKQIYFEFHVIMCDERMLTHLVLSPQEQWAQRKHNAVAPGPTSPTQRGSRKRKEAMDINTPSRVKVGNYFSRGKKEIYFLWNVLEARPTDEGECKKENISTSVTQWPQPVVVLLTCIKFVINFKFINDIKKKGPFLHML